MLPPCNNPRCSNSLSLRATSICKTCQLNQDIEKAKKSSLKTNASSFSHDSDSNKHHYPTTSYTHQYPTPTNPSCSQGGSSSSQPQQYPANASYYQGGSSSSQPPQQSSTKPKSLQLQPQQTTVNIPPLTNEHTPTNKPYKCTNKNSNGSCNSSYAFRQGLERHKHTCKYRPGAPTTFICVICKNRGLSEAMWQFDAREKLLSHKRIIHPQ